MPVRKFRNVEEMSEPRWRPSGQPELWEVMRYLAKLKEKTTSYRFPPGVYKHRSMEEAEALREQWEEENIRRTRVMLVDSASFVCCRIIDEPPDEPDEEVKKDDGSDS